MRAARPRRRCCRLEHCAPGPALRYSPLTAGPHCVLGLPQLPWSILNSLKYWSFDIDRYELPVSGYRHVLFACIDSEIQADKAGCICLHLYVLEHWYIQICTACTLVQAKKIWSIDCDFESSSEVKKTRMHFLRNFSENGIWGRKFLRFKFFFQKISGKSAISQHILDDKILKSKFSHWFYHSSTPSGLIKE